ncbi:MAG: hypothetical protein WAX69_23565 [Victivallales bacterium]
MRTIIFTVMMIVLAGCGPEDVKPPAQAGASDGSKPKAEAVPADSTAAVPAPIDDGNGVARPAAGPAGVAQVNPADGPAAKPAGMSLAEMKARGVQGYSGPGGAGVIDLQNRIADEQFTEATKHVNMNDLGPRIPQKVIVPPAKFKTDGMRPMGGVGY